MLFRSLRLGLEPIKFRRFARQLPRNHPCRAELPDIVAGEKHRDEGEPKNRQLERVAALRELLALDFVVKIKTKSHG